MSILIKMEMPTTCGNCPFNKLWPDDDEDQCMVNRTLWTQSSKRHPDCPLIELPPHGRLIDADALDMNYIHIRDDGMKIYTQRAIDNAPTIIPEETQHGEDRV